MGAEFAVEDDGPDEWPWIYFLFQVTLVVGSWWISQWSYASARC